MCLCVATVKRNVVIYEFNRTKLRHKKIKELMLPAQAQCMEVFGGRLCAGYTSGFGLFSIQGDGSYCQRKCQDKYLKQDVFDQINQDIPTC